MAALKASPNTLVIFSSDNGVRVRAKVRVRNRVRVRVRVWNIVRVRARVTVRVTAWELRVPVKNSCVGFEEVRARDFGFRVRL